MNKKRIFITGISGFLGSHLAASLKKDYSIAGSVRNHTDYPKGLKIYQTKLEVFSSVEKAFQDFKPHTIIHTAAMTSVEACKKDKNLASMVNIEATRQIARWCHQHATRLMFTSTDLVFDGKKGDYTETDMPSPLSYYAKTKLEAEKEVISICPHFIILRICLLYGLAHGPHPSFFQQMIQKVQEGEAVQLFTDEYRTPLYIKEAAAIIEKLIQEEELSGLYHLGGPERISRYEMGIQTAKHLKLDRSKMKGIPINSPHRPKDCSLSSKYLEHQLNLKSRPNLEEVLRSLSNTCKGA